MLHNLVSAGKDRKRVGRGGSRGGTSGRGSKGQKARTSGGVRVGFEGGQMPLTRRLPKRGFNNRAFAQDYTIVSLSVIASLVDKIGVQDITIAHLHEARIVKNGNNKIKVLGATQALEKGFSIETHAISKQAREALEAVGGKVTLV